MRGRHTACLMELTDQLIIKLCVWDDYENEDEYEMVGFFFLGEEGRRNGK